MAGCVTLRALRSEIFNGFNPSADKMAKAELLEVDRWALAELDAVIARVREAYDAYEFHTVYHTLYHFATVTLSARYFDIIKDRLYTFAPRSHGRRSAQTALFRIADALSRMLAPILVFTADEIWENLPRVAAEAEPTVHSQLFPEASPQQHENLFATWNQLFTVRDQVLGALEAARIAKQIGSSLEAQVELIAGGRTLELLNKYHDDLRYIFIVSQVEVTPAKGDTEGVFVNVRPAPGEKCERCWNYSVHVGESARYPTACERCVAALEEIEREAA